MSDDLYKVKTLFNVRQFLAPSEQVTCLDGSLSFLTIGTSHSRVLCLRASGDETSVESGAQLSNQNLPVSHIVLASAFDFILALISPRLFLIDKETRKVHCASINVNVEAFALNTNPAVDSAFILQFAVSTTDKQIIVYNLENRDLNIEYRTHTESNAVALCYSRRCICFATASSYYVHSLASKSTRILFPYDGLNTRPLIVNVDVDEFLLNGMQGLGVFATSSGVSSRPPIAWGSEKIVSIACRAESIFVLNTSSIIVYDCAGKIDETQRVPVDNGIFLYNIDGQVVFCAKDQFCLLKEIQWFERAERLFANNDIEEALRIADDAVCRSQDQTDVLKLNVMKEKAALKFFQKGDFERCSTLANESEMEPRKFIVYYKNLLPLPSGFSPPDRDAEVADVSYLDTRYLGFLEDYLMNSRERNWDGDCGRDIDATLIRVMALRSQKFEDELYRNLQCSYEDCATWLQENKFYKYSVYLAVYFGNFGEALKICRDPVCEKQIDNDLLEYYISNLPRMCERPIFLETMQFLLQLHCAAVLENADKKLLESCSNEILTWLRGRPKELIRCLESWRHLKRPELETKLMTLYLDELERASEEVSVEQSCVDSYRNRLRKLIFESDCYDQKQVLLDMRRIPFLGAEIVLLFAKRKNHTEESLEELLRDYADFDAAELLCSYLGAACPNLYRILLKFYIRSAREHPEFDSRITNLLNSMHATTASDMLEIYDEVPNDWLYKRLATYTTKTILTSRNRELCNSLKKSAIANAINELSREKILKSNKAVRIDEHTCCCVCGKHMGTDEARFNFKTKKIMHFDCSM